MPCVLKAMSVCRLRALIAKPEIIKESLSHNCNCCDTKVQRNEKRSEEEYRKRRGRETKREKELWNVVLQGLVEVRV